MPKPVERQQKAKEDPRWIAFWEIVRREARALDALEERRAGTGEGRGDGE